MFVFDSKPRARIAPPHPAAKRRRRMVDIELHQGVSEEIDAQGDDTLHEEVAEPVATGRPDFTGTPIRTSPSLQRGWLNPMLLTEPLSELVHGAPLLPAPCVKPALWQQQLASASGNTDSTIAAKPPLTLAAERARLTEPDAHQREASALTSRRGWFESRSAWDFSQVPVHRDAPTAITDALCTRTFTAASRVSFEAAHFPARPQLIAYRAAMPGTTGLAVSEPGEALEVEPDRTAEARLRAPGSPTFGCPEPPSDPSGQKGLLGRLTGDEGRIGQAARLVEKTLSSPGQPLDTSSCAFFESRFRWDFGRVRLHADPVASASARALGALGYAVGQHVVLGEGSDAPDSERGRRILAHELAHTIQQSRATGPIARDLAITPAHDPSEAAAEHGAEARGARARSARLGAPAAAAALLANAHSTLRGRRVRSAVQGRESGHGRAARCAAGPLQGGLGRILHSQAAAR
jgi:hypothetical protein